MAISEPLEGIEEEIAQGKESMGAEPESPNSWHEETDAKGQRWNVSPTGQRLKIGGDHVRTGGPTKKEERDRVLGLMTSARKRDEAILRGWCLCPACKVKFDVQPQSDTILEGASNRVYRYGLGTADETTVLKSDGFIKAHARACADCNLDVETMLKLTEALNRHMGLSEK